MHLSSNLAVSLTRTLWCLSNREGKSFSPLLFLSAVMMGVISVDFSLFSHKVQFPFFGQFCPHSSALPPQRGGGVEDTQKKEKKKKERRKKGFYGQFLVWLVLEWKVREAKKMHVALFTLSSSSSKLVLLGVPVEVSCVCPWSRTGSCGQTRCDSMHPLFPVCEIFCATY